MQKSFGIIVSHVPKSLGILVKSVIAGTIALSATAGLVVGAFFHQAPISAALIIFVVAIGLVPNKKPLVRENMPNLILAVVRANALSFTIAGAAIVSSSIDPAMTTAFGCVVVLAATILAFWTWVDRIDYWLASCHETYRSKEFRKWEKSQRQKAKLRRPTVPNDETPEVNRAKVYDYEVSDIPVHAWR